MPALPSPEVPPPDTHKPSPCVRSVHELRREPSASPVSATERLCPVDPAADADEIVTATVSMITTTYTTSCDRNTLAARARPTETNQRRSDQLEESVLRLSRGATTGPQSRPDSGHETASLLKSRPSAAESGTGLRPLISGASGQVVNPTDQHNASAHFGPDSDHIALAITGWPGPPVAPFGMANCAPALTSDNTSTPITHSSQPRARQRGKSPQRGVA